MIFYNGFNLVVDLAIAGFVYLWAHGVGYRKGLWRNKPPFQACWFDTPPEMGPRSARPCG